MRTIRHESPSIEFDDLQMPGESDWTDGVERAKKESQIVAVAKNEAFPPPGKVIFSSLGGPSIPPTNQRMFFSHTQGVVCEK